MTRVLPGVFASLAVPRVGALTVMAVGQHVAGSGKYYRISWTADEMKAKTLFAPKISAVGEMVAQGTAEIAVLQHQLLFEVPGIEIVGPLPGDLQDATVFSAAIMNAAKIKENLKPGSFA